MASPFKFAHEDKRLPDILSSYGWTEENNRAGDIVKNDDPTCKVGVTGPNGRWVAEFRGYYLRGPGGRVRYFSTPSAAIMAVEERLDA